MGHRAPGLPDHHDEDRPHQAGRALRFPQEVRLEIPNTNTNAETDNNAHADTD